MDIFLLRIDRYINEETPDFWQFYNWFQDAYFGDQHSKVRNHLQQDEKDFLDTVNERRCRRRYETHQTNETNAPATRYTQQQLRLKGHKRTLDATRRAVRAQLRYIPAVDSPNRSDQRHPDAVPKPTPLTAHDCSPFEPRPTQNPRPASLSKPAAISRKIRDRVRAPTIQYS